MTSTEFYINMKSIPDDKSSEYDAFFAEELRKIEYGVTINGVFIPGWLYWHVNHWFIDKDVKDPITGLINGGLGHPDLRDTDWTIASHREQAIKQQKGLLIIGSRRLGKSESLASIIGRSATIYNGSANVVSGGNAPDIKLITDKIERGLSNVHPFFRFSRIEDNWKSQVTLGVKERGGRRLPWSSIMIRNFEDGVNTEAAAGIKAKEFIIDEIGKFPFMRAFEAAKPAFTSPFGWRACPILTGTGGSFDRGDDAQKVFEDPESQNILSIEVKDETKKYGLFIPGTWRMEAKELTTFGATIETELPKNSELFSIPYWQSNIQKGEEIIDAEREQAKKSSDMETLLKAIMYYPKNPQECFLNSGSNFYNGDLARFQKARILAQNLTGTPVILKHNGEHIIHEFTDKKSISKFPEETGTNRDAPIVIWEFPVPNPIWGLYVCGVDPYRHDNGKSNGAVYIYKRMHDIASEKYQDMFVASYVARPKTKEEWNEQARLLIKFYNARVLCENDEYGFIEYMKSKGDEHYLEVQPAWIKAYAASSTIKRDFGISRTHKGIRNHLMSCLKMYMEETILKEKDKDGSVTKEILGVSRILDPMLLEEISKWNEDGNFDREVAASLAIALARHMDPVVGKVSDSDSRLKSFYQLKRRPGVFSSGASFKRLFL